MDIHDFLWIIPTLVGALNAWQNKSISEAILGLKVELTDRIGRTEGNVKEINGRCRAMHALGNGGE